MDECDVVVPRKLIPDFVRKMREIGEKETIRIRVFGHAGDGNLHIYVCRDELTENVWKEKIARVMDFLYAAARSLGGNVSGEHGIGHAKRPYLLSSVGGRQMDLMRGIKAAFDPNCILNPGKVIS